MTPVATHDEARSQPDPLQRNAETHAVVTGGTQGLGLAITRQLVREGARSVVISGRNAERGKQAAAEICALGAECHFVQADLAKIDDCVRLMETAISHLGYVNALVNAAADPGRGTLTDTTVDIWESHFHTNARGPFLTMQALVRHLLEIQRPGSIVNILSEAARCGQSYLTSYSASKGALATLTKNVANAYASDRIRCNGILVGWMETPGEAATQKRFHGKSDNWLEEAEASTPMGQLVKPDQLAVLVTYMLSPQSGVMTGALVDYDQLVADAYPEQP